MARLLQWPALAIKHERHREGYRQLPGRESLDPAGQYRHLGEIDPAEEQQHQGGQGDASAA